MIIINDKKMLNDKETEKFRMFTIAIKPRTKSCTWASFRGRLVGLRTPPRIYDFNCFPVNHIFKTVLHEPCVA